MTELTRPTGRADRRVAKGLATEYLLRLCIAVSLLLVGESVANGGPPPHAGPPSSGRGRRGPQSSMPDSATTPPLRAGRDKAKSGDGEDHESHHEEDDSGGGELFLPGTTVPRLLTGQRLSQQDRSELETRADYNVMGGRARIVDGLRRLADAGEGDPQAVEASLAEVHQGVREVSKGLALRRALSAPETASERGLEWVREDLGLRPSPAPPQPESGIGLFHAAVMAILIAFAGAMLWMYFFKMRRAAALLSTLEAAAPPPGRRPVEQPPRSSSWRGDLRVAAVFKETEGVKTFRLCEPEGKRIPFDFLPGQFLTLRVTPKNKTVQRSYTIASSPSQRDYVEITVKRDERGVVSRFLHDHVAEGDALTLAAAPSGRFTFTGQEADAILLIAGGVGITPMMSIVRYLADWAWRGSVHLVACCRREHDLIFAGELAGIAQRHPNFRLTTVVSDPGPDWDGPRGRLTREMLLEHVPDVAKRRVHLCGPPPMMDAVSAILLEAGVPKAEIHTEKFGPVRRRAREAGESEGASKKTGVKHLPMVSFRASGKKAALAPDSTILDAAESVGIDIDNSCRVGTCGTCMVRLLEGKVTMAVEDGLHPDDKADGFVLACQACAQADVVVDV